MPAGQGASALPRAGMEVTPVWYVPLRRRQIAAAKSNGRRRRRDGERVNPAQLGVQRRLHCAPRAAIAMACWAAGQQGRRRHCGSSDPSLRALTPPGERLLGMSPG